MLPWETQEMLKIELPHLSEGRSTLCVQDMFYDGSLRKFIDY